MIPFCKYFLLTLKHKWFVFVAGFGIVPLWRLVIHDWTKLLPWDCYQYGKQFFGKADDPLGFAITWLRHQNDHPHHWEYWIPRTSNKRGGFEDGKPLPMPQWAVDEMIADWMAASRAYEGCWPSFEFGWDWFKNYFSLVRENLHPETQKLLINRMMKYGFSHCIFIDAMAMKPQDIKVKVK